MPIRHRGSWRSLLVSGALLSGCSAGSKPPPAAPGSAPLRADGGVCRFDGSLELPAPSADGSIAVPPNHPLISYL
ncbi:MAG TPA: hypothetical protein VEQ58_16125, partial [Polyangiaceae bacterium]|nr:hypothetical protein [Polyangiaceae bacterium]